ncbi:hypothetical protein KFE96_06705 [Kordiimonas sp. SCSIO 12603]|uniref:hypothetical protein n=1 Tax=Kordiimonas sp. SCSIO 12603 TaxID=2829596 RepID=UPI002103C12E|nr:hypothetical protein [Kordiimonas sp. SCSIO 12603]UTW59991.1 hypothetical protein KFE96_06705 [Kordiimonas sp. SCSIO 12603]
MTSDVAALPAPGGAGLNLQEVQSLLAKVGEKFGGLATGLSAVPGLTNISSSLMEAANTALGASTRIGEMVSGGAGSVPAQGGEVEEEGEEANPLDKTKTTINELAGLWDSYYQDLFDKDGKLNTEKAKNLALEVGDTILGTKKMAKVRKALAVGNVVRSTAEAVMVAAKSAPFPANLLPIGKAVALGAKQLSAVKGQAHDGINNIPSTGTYLLEKGERVVDSRLNTDLTGYLKAQRALNGTNSVPNSNHTVNNSPVLNLSFSGDVSGDAVRSNRGEIESMIREVFADHAMVAPFDAA